MTAPQIARPEKSRPLEPDDGVYYPMACDVLPPEGMIHFVPQSYMQSALETWLDDPETLVASQMFIYYEPGNPSVSVSPDVYVIPGVGSDLRRSYFLWVEHQVPTFAMEVTSPSTHRRDRAFKRDLYESWGVLEYWQYDPYGIHLTPLLQGNRLVDGRYQSIPVEVAPDNSMCIGYSELLKLELRARREWFRFRDPVTGKLIRNRQEMERDYRVSERARFAAERAHHEAERARFAAEEALHQERAARLEMENLLRQHGIEPPGSGA